MRRRDVGWNLAGFGLPLLVAVACIPPLIAELGAARFGLLTLVWAVVSYFGVFDLGLGRALTQRVSAALGAGRDAEVPGIVSTGLAALLVLGSLAGALMWAAAPAGVALFSGLPDPDEALRTARAMAWSVPFIVLTSGVRGVLESRGTFRAINVIRIVTGTLTYVLPIALVRAGENDLVSIAWALGGMRAAGLAWHGVVLARALPDSVGPRHLCRGALAGLLRFGGWLTVGNVVSPLMGYLDRFVVATLLSLDATAWYVTPKEMVTKLLVVPTAIGGVLFPRLSALGARPEGAAAAMRLEGLAMSAIFATLFPVTLGLALGAPLILELWIDASFAREGAAAMAIVAFGVLLNALATVPYLSLQARGRADLTAIVNALELPFFIAAIHLMTSRWGVTGAAAAWSLRVAVDFVVLAGLSRGAGDRARAPGSVRATCAAVCIGSCASAAFALAFLDRGATGVGAAVLAGCAAMATLGVVHRDRLWSTARPGSMAHPARRA
jgi:O-antigen/teichoic acid export membrane protein